MPALPPAVRCWLWWGVALKMLLGLLPLPALSLPLLPAGRGNETAVMRLAPMPAAVEQHAAVAHRCPAVG